MTPRPTLPIASRNPNVDTLARRLGLKYTKAYRWAQARGLVYNIDGTLRVDPAELDALIPRLRVAAPETPKQRQQKRIEQTRVLRELAPTIVREIRGRHS